MDSAPKTQKNVPNHGADDRLQRLAFGLDEREVGLPGGDVLPEDRGVGERREDRDREDADEPERHQLLLVRDRPPAVEAPEVRLVLARHRSRCRRGGFFARDRRHDARDVDAHPEALVANPVALREVVDAAGAGEYEAAQDERDRDDIGVRQLSEMRDRLRQGPPTPTR